MLAKARKEFIDLGKTPTKLETAPMADMEKNPKPFYPSFYIDKNIGLKDEDLDQPIVATVRLVPKRISKSVTNGKERYSCDIEVHGIKFGG